MKRNLEYTLKRIKADLKFFLAIAFISSLFAFALFAGTLVRHGMSNAIENSEKRLGADIMLVPKGAAEGAEGLLLTGQRGSFYFESDIGSDVGKVEGISEVSAQTFLKSLSADCCSSEVQIVFFDPDTDFTVGPWIEEKYSKKLESMQVIAGHDIDVEDKKIKLFGKEYEVVAKMSKTGTSLDSSVYFDIDSAAAIVKTAGEKGVLLSENQKKGNITSSVFINLSEGFDVGKVVARLHSAADEEFDVIYPKQLSENLGKDLKAITGMLDGVMTAVCLVVVLILFVTGFAVMNLKKAEIAVLRVLGNTRRKIKGMLILEVSIAGLAGAVAGELLGILLVLPFGNYIGRSFGMPYLLPGTLNIIIYAAITFIAIILVTSLAAFVSSGHVCRMEPYHALRKEAE